MLILQENMRYDQKPSTSFPSKGPNEASTTLWPSRLPFPVPGWRGERRTLVNAHGVLEDEHVVRARFEVNDIDNEI